MYGKHVPIIVSVSASAIASLDGSVSSKPRPPRLYGLSSGITDLPKSALTTGALSLSATANTLSPAPIAPCPTSITILVPELRISTAFSINERLGIVSAT